MRPPATANDDQAGTDGVFPNLAGRLVVPIGRDADSVAMPSRLGPSNWAQSPGLTGKSATSSRGRQRSKLSCCWLAGVGDAWLFQYSAAFCSADFCQRQVKCGTMSPLNSLTRKQSKEGNERGHEQSKGAQPQDPAGTGQKKPPQHHEKDGGGDDVPGSMTCQVESPALRVQASVSSVAPRRR